MTARVELVVVGGSWGGLDAACRLLAEVTRPAPVPILLVLHRGKGSREELMRSVVGRCCGHRLAEVDDKAELVAGVVHAAPPDYHVLVDDGAVSLSTEGPVNHSRPSIDLAFESAADELTAGVVAVLLSGAGCDGAAGLRRVFEQGGRVLVQSPTTAERAEMPAAGIAALPRPPELVAGPEALGRHLDGLLRQGRP